MPAHTAPTSAHSLGLPKITRNGYTSQGVSRDTQTVRNSGNGAHQTLSHVAHMANRLAKQLSGPDQALAYQIKAAACSALIIDGSASVNGVRANDILALDILSNPPSRLHIPLMKLQAEARARVRSLIDSAPAVAPLSECRGSEQLQSFMEHGRRKALL